MTGSRTIRHIRKYPNRILNISLILAGIFTFAIFIHHPLPLRVVSFVAISGSSLIIGHSTRNDSVLSAFGLLPLSRRILYYLIPALMLGTGLGWLTRSTFDLSPLPASLTHIAFVAPLIGAIEELIFRGFIQGYLRPIGRFFSIVYAATGHTCYKLLVILSLRTPLQFDFFFLVLWTFVGGLAFGLLREGARSSIPPVIAHAVFDILLYGGYALIPVWVWS